MNTPVGPTHETVARIQREQGLTLAEAVVAANAGLAAGTGGLRFRSPSVLDVDALAFALFGCPSCGDTPEFPAAPCRLCGN